MSILTMGMLVLRLRIVKLRYVQNALWQIDAVSLLKDLASKILTAVQKNVLARNAKNRKDVRQTINVTNAEPLNAVNQRFALKGINRHAKIQVLNVRSAEQPKSAVLQRRVLEREKQRNAKINRQHNQSANVQNSADHVVQNVPVHA